MGQIEKITPAALACACSSKSSFCLKVGVRVILLTLISPITSVEKENLSLNIKNGQVPEERFNFNRCN